MVCPARRQRPQSERAALDNRLGFAPLGSRRHQSNAWHRPCASTASTPQPNYQRAGQQALQSRFRSTLKQRRRVGRCTLRRKVQAVGRQPQGGSTIEHAGRQPVAPLPVRSVGPADSSAMSRRRRRCVAVRRRASREQRASAATRAFGACGRAAPQRRRVMGIDDVTKHAGSRARRAHADADGRSRTTPADAGGRRRTFEGCGA